MHWVKIIVSQREQLIHSHEPHIELQQAGTPTELH